MTDGVFHVFVPTGEGSCVVCHLSVHAEVHGCYPDVCITCGHAKAHTRTPQGLCEFENCDCGEWIIGNKPLIPSDVLHLCDRCHGEVYTFPSNIVSLAQRKVPGIYWAAFTFEDEDCDELLIFPQSGSAVFSINREESVRIPLNVLEAVVDALRVTGLRAVEGDDPK